MGMFDTLLAELECPICGAVSPADPSTGMQTKLRREPDLRDLMVGSEFRIDPAALEDFSLLHEPGAADSVRLAVTWRCPGCRALQWAEVVIKDDVIRSIAAIVLDEATIDRLNYVDVEVRDYLAMWEEDEDWVDGEAPSVVDVLKAVARRRKL